MPQLPGSSGRRLNTFRTGIQSRYLDNILLKECEGRTIRVCPSLCFYIHLAKSQRKEALTPDLARELLSASPGRKKFLLPQGKRILPRIDFPFKDLKRTFKDLKHAFKDLKHTFKVFERKIVLGRREFFTPKAGKRTAIQRKKQRRCMVLPTPMFCKNNAIVFVLMHRSPLALFHFPSPLCPCLVFLYYPSSPFFSPNFFVGSREISNFVPGFPVCRSDGTGMIY